jgi:flagellar basal-body rod protein FlgF
MLYGMYISAAGALAHSHRQDVIANNLANVDTVSFKRDLAVLQTRRTEAVEKGSSSYTADLLEKMGGGTFAHPVHTDYSPASLEETGNFYDLALEGKGFFSVRNGEQVHYTRDGRFAVNDKNQLVTIAGGYPVLDEGGKPITIDRDLDFSVNDQGFVSQGGAMVARLGIADIADTGKLSKQGNNMYVNEGGEIVQLANTPVKQGFVENSAVVAVNELTNMIQAQRIFQANTSLLQMQDRSLGLAVTKLGMIS